MILTGEVDKGKVVALRGTYAFTVCFWTEEPVQTGLCMNLQTSYWKNFAFDFQKIRTVLAKFVVCWFLYFPYLTVKKKGFPPLKLKDFGLNGLDTMYFVLLHHQQKLVE